MTRKCAFETNIQDFSFHFELFLQLGMKMSYCQSCDIFDDFSQASNFNAKFLSEYHQISQELFRDSKNNIKTLHLDEFEDMLIRLFPILIKKRIHKRSSEGFNSVDMPVVFMPQKSGADCVSKPKVKTIYLILVVAHRIRLRYQSEYDIE